jgi:hypothetical protein
MTDAAFWDVTETAYHADTEYLGSTGIKLWLKNRTLFHRRYVDGSMRRDMEQSDAMKLGSLFHGFVLEGKTNWTVYNGGRRAGKEWEKFSSDAFLKGVEVVTGAEHTKLLGMHEAVMANPVARDLLLDAKGYNETAARWTHKTGVKCKCKWDRLLYDGRIPDIKIVADPSDEFFAKQVHGFRYDVQAAHYMQGSEAVLPGRELTFLFVTVCSEPPYECYVRTLPERAIRIGHAAVDTSLQEIKTCRETGVWADSRSEGVYELDLPGFYWQANAHYLLED